MLRETTKVVELVQDNAEPYTPWLNATSFWYPNYLVDSGWIEHAPFAFWITSILRPRTLVELGTHHGYSYFAFCQAIHNLQLESRCYAVDTWKGDEHAGFYGEDVFEHVRKYNEAHYASFSRLVRSTFDEALPHFADASIDLLHIDGRHFCEDVKHDFESWRCKLSERAVVLFHDTNVREGGFGVSKLWSELSADFAAFEFLHGHGLGVLGYGPRLPEAMSAFFAVTSDASQINEVRSAYARLGAALQSGHAQSRELAAALGERERHIAILKDEVASLSALAHDREQHIAILNDEAASLSARLARAEGAHAEVLNTWSWRLTAPLRVVAGPAYKLKPLLRRLTLQLHSKIAARRRDSVAMRRRIAESGLFDREWYLLRYPDVAHNKIDPLNHYVTWGAAEGRDPNLLFKSQWYRSTYPDAATTTNPLLHYLEFGRGEGRETRPPDTYQPDDDVYEERLAGLQFCARHALSLDGSPEQPDYAAAVAELAASAPAATINRESPDVSIIIPIYGQLAVTLNCLDSLARHRTRYSFELIIADDASPEASETRRLDEIPWVRYIRRRQNGGFIATCNEAAAAARGRFLVFLNNDTRVARDWLDEMIGSFAIYPKAGLVGSKLFNADGSLQEAGGFLSRSGKAWNYGRNSDSNEPRYCFARRADYCSAASIALPAVVWAEAGGFDTDYAPAYWEDVDLAFRLRQLGYEVWFQPLSRVIHYEGKSHGRDLTRGVKAYQITNMKRVAERWCSVLDTHGPDSHQPDREANRFAKRRMLVIDALIPTPDQDAGSVITRQMIEAMQKLGWQIIFVSIHNHLYHARYTRDLQRIGVECLYAPFVNSIGQALDLHPDVDVVLGYRVGVLAPIYDELRRRLPTARILFHDIDLHYLREEREAELLNDMHKRIHAVEQREQELGLIAMVDCTLVPTRVEKVIIEEQVPVANILEFPYVVQVQRSNVPFEKRRDLMFLGGYAHAPNVDAVEFFVSQVWPLLVRELPATVRFLVVGANPPARLRALACDRILVTGQVSELGPYFDMSRAFVAPLRYGAGIKGKLIHSMAYGLPSVVSSTGAEGMMITSGEQAIIADSPEAIRQAVMDLFENRDLWLAMQASGYDFVEKNYSGQRCVELCQKAIDIADETWLERRRVLADRTIKQKLAQIGVSVRQ
jgi:GT2 family glycosyltransferase